MKVPDDGSRGAVFPDPLPKGFVYVGEYPKVRHPIGRLLLPASGVAVTEHLYFNDLRIHPVPDMGLFTPDGNA